MHSLHAGLYATMEQVEKPPAQPFHAKKTFSKHVSVVDVVPYAKVIKIFGNSHYELSTPESRALNSICNTVKSLFALSNDNLKEWGLLKSAMFYELHLRECIGYSRESKNLETILKTVQEQVTSICLEHSISTKPPS
jgi:hypothetical protein